MYSNLNHKMSLYIPRVGGNNEEYDAAAKKTPACGDGYDCLHNIMDYLVTEEVARSVWRRV